jgi:hypothetical protein
MFIHFKQKYNLFFIITLFFTLNTFAQSNSAIVNEFPPAKDEVFVKTSGLISSGRMLGTMPNGVSIDFNHPKTELMNIYDKDGQLWYRFSIWNETPLSIHNNKKEFVPFTSWDVGSSGGVGQFWLRLVAESSHWYEVEINEETQETKYILKQDQSFARTDFRYYVGPRTAGGKENVVRIDTESNPLLDAPDGKKIDAYISKEVDKYLIWELKGDWIRVAIVDGSKVKAAWTNGWVRWRDGRKILVGSYLTFWKI